MLLYVMRWMWWEKSKFPKCRSLILIYLQYSHLLCGKVTGGERWLNLDLFTITIAATFICTNLLSSTLFKYSAILTHTYTMWCTTGGNGNLREASVHQNRWIFESVPLYLGLEIMIFRKWGGVKGRLEDFPKTHPFWWTKGFPNGSVIFKNL